ncbi:MAG TPA: fibronectin type III domain-containing protein [Propionibacteriaceae bacterium]|nr:fibronectin type III domain-containing protein [Propionibacteriaceae bacterium]
MSIAVVGALTLAGLVSVGGSIASAAVPTFPDNVVVFPDRDFITIEGYQDHIGETATVEVLRGGTVVGSAKGVVGEGDVAFEINHPGGYCWGAGTGLDVTPNIVAGDVARITFPNGESGETTTSSATVTSDAALSGSTLTVTGTVGSDVTDTSRMEQRIINPDLVDTAVGRRDIRAIPGPLTRADKGGYSSGMTVSSGQFTATYVFDDPAVAKIASEADLGERAMYWQEEDADGNRQGLTIAEFGEAGGPGMGGCPAGPTDQAPPAGSYSAIRSDDGTKLAVTWTPATAVPGADAVTGYSVEAIAPAVSGVSGSVGARTGLTTKTTLNVDPAVATYAVEVRSLAGQKMGLPFTVTSTPTTTAPAGDTTAPKLTITPAPSTDGTAVKTSQVTLASETGSDIYFTTDGTPAVSGDLPSDSATLYTGPIPIKTANTEVRVVAFDRAGNADTGFGLYSPLDAPTTPLAAPADLQATPGEGSVRLDWSAVTDATSYQVTVTPAPSAGQPASVTARTQTITGLTGNTTYTFDVTASDGTRTSAPSTVTSTPAVVTAKVAITTGRWKNADMRIQGTTNTEPTAGTIRFYRATTDGKASTTTVGGTANQTLTAAVAPATGSTFSARYRTTALTGTTNPGRIVAVLSDSAGNVLGTSPVFTLTNG